MTSLSHGDQTEDLTILYGIDDAVNRLYPELLPSFHAGLAVVGAMALAERVRPLSLIFEGGSGNGKSEIVQSLFPLAGSDMGKYIYRSDSWTSKSFVTHASTMKKAHLRKVDMLPKLKDKILVTKELATIFRGHEHELADNFKSLIAVLDGQGLTGDSGTHGQRGYEDRIIFNWIGGTTPLPDATYRLMSQLGNRLLFWEVPAVRPKKEKLLAYIMQNHAATDQDDVRQKVNEFVESFFLGIPVGSIDRDEISAPRELMLGLSNWTRLLTAGRAEVKYEKVGTNWTPIAAMPPEGPWRVADYLKELAFGHCVIHGRRKIDKSDLRIVQHAAVSSIPRHLRPLVRELGRSGTVETGAAMTLCGVSHPTARNYLSEVALLGIGVLQKGEPATNRPHSITLANEYVWLRQPLKG